MTPVPLLLKRVIDLIGDRLTCYIVGFGDAEALATLQSEGDPPWLTTHRLEVALQTALVLRTQYSDDQIAVWFTWMNDHLNDESPARFLRSVATEDECQTHARALIAAAKAYLM